MDIVKRLNDASSLAQVFFEAAESYPDNEVYSQSELTYSKVETPLHKIPRNWRKQKYSEVSSRVAAIAAYLQSIGIKKDDKVAIVSNSRAEWMESDLAVLAAGGISVSVYQSLPAADIAYILHDSDARVVFIENIEQLEKIKEIKTQEFDIPAVENRPALKVRLEIKNIISFEHIEGEEDVVSLQQILKSDYGKVELQYLQTSRNDLASLVYTSGTTGPPKGVMQTHGNHLANIRQAYRSGMFKTDSCIMIVLPLAHSFAKLMGYICFLTPARAAFPAIADKKSSKLIPESITKDISLSGATIYPLVPRMLEKMQAGIEKQAAAKSITGFLLGPALSVAGEVRKLIKEGRKAQGYLLIKYFLTKPLRRIIRKKLFGPNFCYVISGGAKLSVDTAYFFEAMEIEVLEGYGLTETCVATNVNREGAKKIGTVGPVLDKDIEVTLGEDGEIRFRGPNVAKGYWNRPHASADSWDEEGWFHTGDLGSLDSEGYLSITGRKKELIVTAGGKKIAPDNIESKLKSIKYVSQAVLYGEGKPYCVALVTVDTASVKLPQGSAQQADKEKLLNEVHQKIWSEVENLNKMLASFESIKRIALIEEDFTIDNGLLTPTLKVKRSKVMEHFRDLIESLYEKTN